MHQRLGASLALACAFATITVLGAPADASTGQFASQSSAAGSLTEAGKKPKPPPRFYPSPGPVFNNPLGGRDAQFRVIDKIKNAISAVPPGGEIRIMSWNMMSADGVNRLLGAQRRGVKVRLLMDSTNLTDIPNPQFKRLRGGLAAGNKGRKPKRRSTAKVCNRSCRGERGQAHSKFYLFSKVGRTKRVLMEGSANLTTAAAINQWNDIYTFNDNKVLYKFAGDVFEQMWDDTPVADPYVTASTGQVQLYFSPFGGANFQGDPTQQILDAVKCTGTGKNAGSKGGRTIVRVAPDVMRNNRGLLAAQRLKQLWDQGCDVRIAYTVLGYDSFKVLNSGGGRGRVPMRHIVQDLDGDGEFDNYFHLKAITINGRMGDDRSVHLVINGSSNISGASSLSDEQIAIIRRTSSTLAYQRYIDYWFNHAPPIHGHSSSREALRTLWRAGVNPYAHVDMD